jgi:hypothetical protein
VEERGVEVDVNPKPLNGFSCGLVIVNLQNIKNPP